MSPSVLIYVIALQFDALCSRVRGSRVSRLPASFRHSRFVRRVFSDRESFCAALALFLGRPKLNYCMATHTPTTLTGHFRSPRRKRPENRKASARPPRTSHSSHSGCRSDRGAIRQADSAVHAGLPKWRSRARASVGKRALGRTPRRPNAPSTQATVNSSESTAHLPWNMPVGTLFEHVAGGARRRQ